MKKIFTTLALLTCLLSAQVQGQTPQGNLASALQYLKAYEELDFDKMGTFYHDSIVFEDAIYEEVYKQPGRVEGKAQVVQTWKTVFKHKPEYIRITVRESFATGNYVVIDQIFENMTRAGEKTSLIKGQLLTVLKFKNGKIISQKDFTEYAAFNRQMFFQSKNEKIALPTNPNIETALAYMQTYAAWDLDKMGEFYHDGVHFTDFTAIEAFPGAKFDHTGKTNVTDFWKGIFGPNKPPFVNVTVHNAFATGSFVVLNTVFELVLPANWTRKPEERVYVSFPIKTVLRFEGGKIISQMDFANYDLYNKQIQIQTRPATK